MMAAVTGLLFLLTSLIGGMRGEETINTILKPGDTLYFDTPRESDFCVISRSVGEENLVLWNTSDPSPENNPTLPEDLRKRLFHLVLSITNYYWIGNMTYTDSGLYKQECWTDGTVTLQRNINVNVCDDINENYKFLNVISGGTVDMPCEGAGANLTVQWFRSKDLKEDSPWTRLLVDDDRSLNPLMKHLAGRVQLVRNNSSLRISNLTRGDIVGPCYACLVMDGQRCVVSNRIILFPATEHVYLSVGDEAVLPCFDTDRYGLPTNWTRSHVGKLKTFPVPPFKNHSSESFGNLTGRGRQHGKPDEPTVNHNYSLVFSSLTSFHDAVTYDCTNDQYIKSYYLLVCPESAPVTQYYSCGEEVTLSCNYMLNMHTAWIRKDVEVISPYHTYTENYQIKEGFKGKVNVSYPYSTVVLSNLSSEDSGEYMCVVFDLGCKSATKTILIYEGCLDVVSAVKSSLVSCGLLGMVCAVVTVIVKARRKEKSSVI